MKKQKEKQKNAGYALKGVKPIPPVTVKKIVRTRFGRNYNSVNRMKKKRQKNTENFDKEQIRQMMYVRDVVFKNLLAAHHRRIRIDMREIINSKRHNARQLMQFSE